MQEDGTDVSLTPRRLIGWEIFVVFAVSLGASGVRALVELIGSLTAPQALSKQQALLVGTLAPGRPWLDLALQLVSLAQGLAPVALVWYMLARSGEGLSDIGVDLSQPARDGLRGAALAALIGGTGLGLYLIAFHLGVSLNVVAESLPPVWWRIPVLVLNAAQNGILEEIVVLGYLIRRLGQLGWSPWAAIVFSAVLRGSYHLYQGFGGFVGNAIMGLIFGYFYQRTRRVLPLVVAHTILDVVSFVGYTLFHNKLSFLR